MYHNDTNPRPHHHAPSYTLPRFLLSSFFTLPWSCVHFLPCSIWSSFRPTLIPRRYTPPSISPPHPSIPTRHTTYPPTSIPLIIPFVVAVSIRLAPRCPEQIVVSPYTTFPRERAPTCPFLLVHWFWFTGLVRVTVLGCA